MALYETLLPHFINGRWVEKGQVIRYDGIPGRHLEPVDAEAHDAVDEAEQDREDRRSAVARGETVDEPVDVVSTATAPQLVKSHPILPNLEGSSGEITGESPIASPEAKAKLAREIHAATEKRAVPHRAKAKRGKKAVKRKAKAAEPQPARAQSDPIVTPDQQ